MSTVTTPKSGDVITARHYTGATITGELVAAKPDCCGTPGCDQWQLYLGGHDNPEWRNVSLSAFVHSVNVIDVEPGR